VGGADKLPPKSGHWTSVHVATKGRAVTISRESATGRMMDKSHATSTKRKAA
jgi:hypothetical protein